MIIKRVELVNYCQHEHREIDVSGNLIAVVGHNGVGKSNMLGALQFALTGEQPGKTKAELLHWGAKEGHVTLEFEQDGKPGRIERSVSSNKVTLEYDGVTTSGITNVAKEMETRLHMDKDLVRQSVFVRQTEVDTIISAKTDKRDREVAFQKLLGIDAAKIHKNLTDWMYAAAKPVNYDIQLTEAVQRLGEQETRKADTAREVEEAKAALQAFGEVDDSQSANIGKAIAAITSVLHADVEREACHKAVADLEKEFNDAVSAAGSVPENPHVDVAEVSAEISALQQEITKGQLYAKAKKDFETAEENLKRHQDAPHPTAEEVQTANGEWELKHSLLMETRVGITQHMSALENLGGGMAKCPVCGQALGEHAIDDLKVELKKLHETRTELETAEQEARGKRDDVKHAFDTWKGDVQFYTSNYNQFKRTFDQSTPPTVDMDTAATALADAQNRLMAQKSYDAAVSRHKEAITSAELRLKVAKQAQTDAMVNWMRAEEEGRKLCGDEAANDWKQAKATLESIVAETDKRRSEQTALKIRLARAEAAYAEAVRTLDTLGKTVESLRQQQAEQDQLAKRLATLEKVRDWFHYANGPRILVTQVLAALTDDVNRFLGNFTAPFIVIPDNEEVGFKVEFTDGRTRPEDPPGTDVLSGGERVQLAVAFRLAIYGMFAGKLGLLSLDEPTAYLDDGNVDRFGVLLTKVRELARNMNTQVFMATHERAVIPHMDSIIDLN